MPKPLIDRMADHVENFDCAAYADGRLIIFTGSLSWGTSPGRGNLNGIIERRTPYEYETGRY